MLSLFGARTGTKYGRMLARVTRRPGPDSGAVITINTTLVHANVHERGVRTRLPQHHHLSVSSVSLNSLRSSRVCLRIIAVMFHVNEPCSAVNHAPFSYQTTRQMRVNVKGRVYDKTSSRAIPSTITIAVMTALPQSQHQYD